MYDRSEPCVLMLPPLPALFAKRLLDSMSESVVVFDAQYVITYWNRAAALLFGWDADDRTYWFAPP